MSVMREVGGIRDALAAIRRACDAVQDATDRLQAEETGDAMRGVRRDGLGSSPPEPEMPAQEPEDGARLSAVSRDVSRSIGAALQAGQPPNRDLDTQGA